MVIKYSGNLIFKLFLFELIYLKFYWLLLAAGIEACECFTSKFIPQYAKKYKKIIKGYYDEFKTLKHRKK